MVAEKKTKIRVVSLKPPTGCYSLYVMAWGVGGGKTASSIATTTIITHVRQAPTANPDESNENLLREAVIAANRALRNKIIEVPELNGMGTTVTALLLSPAGATLAHVGDSRIYQLRQRKMIFRTADHSRVGEMVRAGALTEEQARLSAISNIITRALGIKDEIEVDVQTIPYEKGDRFVLCTDGVWGSMPQPQLIRAFSNNSIDNGVEILNLQVEQAGKEKGGHHDNYTMIMVEAKESSTKTATNSNVNLLDATPNKKDSATQNAAKKQLDSRIIAAIITGIIVTPALVYLLLFLNWNPKTDSIQQDKPIDDIGNVDSIHNNPTQDHVHGNNESNRLDQTVTNKQGTANDHKDSTATEINQTDTEAVESNLNDTPIDTSTERLTARKEALDSIKSLLTELKIQVGTMEKNAGIKATKAKEIFQNAKKEAIRIVNELLLISGYEYSPEERALIERELTHEELKGGRLNNGLKGSIGQDLNNYNMPDKAGYAIIKKTVKTLSDSINKKIDETDLKLQN